MSYGLPAYVQGDGWLDADEVRSLGETRLVLVRESELTYELYADDEIHGGEDVVCACCRKSGVLLDFAHIVRKGSGGRGDGREGFRVGLCRPCHSLMDREHTFALGVTEGHDLMIAEPILVAPLKTRVRIVASLARFTGLRL